MTRVSFKPAAATVGAYVLLTAITLEPSLAATFSLQVDLTEVFAGSLAVGDSFSGSFSFDETVLTGIGTEFLDVDSLEFGFLDETFTEASDPLGGLVGFENSQLLGLEFSVDPLQADSPSFGIFGTDFAYGEAGSFTFPDGLGTVSYAAVPTTTDVPEASVVMGLLAMGVGSLLLNRFHTSC
ncbi:hypothetical protein [Leptothoe spongobia]|uniref:PEP-CTERM protein-sorting domain-containing protein n=1 Tax=Leptothoe spongobia TAU-MAC 1115 TaxID=1967444 RepID=A0A947GJX6_9CYAN|nr:hypothetical protein [Leptothoe spongobia]MBT9317380.1 hypothetical protein [Leptothoe spongobia TAU-MAC 1115]